MTPPEPTNSPTPTTVPPRPGALLFDTETDTVGELQDTQRGLHYLRPIGGGREWTATPDAVRPATDAERITAGVRAANARSTSTLR
jgi:hypothetical protein